MTLLVDVMVLVYALMILVDDSHYMLTDGTLCFIWMMIHYGLC